MTKPYKVEMVCLDEHLDAVMAAMKRSHPYETPAFDIIKLHQIPLEPPY